MDSKVWFGIAGGVFLIGVVVLVCEKTGVNPLAWFGKLPGDFHQTSDSGSFNFPMTSCLLISVVGSLLLNLINRFFS